MQFNSVFKEMVQPFRRDNLHRRAKYCRNSMIRSCTISARSLTLGPLVLRLRVHDNLRITNTIWWKPPVGQMACAASGHAPSQPPPKIHGDLGVEDVSSKAMKRRVAARVAAEVSQPRAPVVACAKKCVTMSRTNESH